MGVACPSQTLGEVGSYENVRGIGIHTHMILDLRGHE